MGLGGQRDAPAVIAPGKSQYPLYRWLGGPQSWSGRVRKLSPHTGIRSPDRPACSESLYRLNYPGPNNVCNLSCLFLYAKFVIQKHWQLHYICLHHCIHTATLLHVSALKGPSSGSTDTICEQGQLNTCSITNIPEDGPFKAETFSTVIVWINWY